MNVTLQTCIVNVWPTQMFHPQSWKYTTHYSIDIVNRLFDLNIKGNVVSGPIKHEYRNVYRSDMDVRNWVLLQTNDTIIQATKIVLKAQHQVNETCIYHWQLSCRHLWYLSLIICLYWLREKLTYLQVWAFRYKQQTLQENKSHDMIYINRRNKCRL